MASPCTRCGHTLWQHSTGECDIAGCECPGWTSSMVVLAQEIDWPALVVCWVAGLLVGLVLGWAL